MRMWMVEPKNMCDRHLLGEHVELHMFVGTLKLKKSINGYIKNDLLEPLSISTRHSQLVKEMKMRGFNHSSPLNFKKDLLDYLPNWQKCNKINKEQSGCELIVRCNDCFMKGYENEVLNKSSNVLEKVT